MIVPIVVVASAYPTPELLAHVAPDSIVVPDRATWSALVAPPAIERGASSGMPAVVSPPDVHYRSPGCECCAVREDLVAAIVRATQRANPPTRLAVFVNPNTEDVLTVVATILSSVEIARRCELDAVVVGLDAVELATRVTTIGDVFTQSDHTAIGGTTTDSVVGGAAIAATIADRIVLQRADQVTAHVRGETLAALSARTGFARIVTVDTPTVLPGLRLDAWHGAPNATDTGHADVGIPTTVVLNVDTPLDPDAIDDWLDQLVAQHARRLYRVQGALSVVGQDDRICLYGVRSFATSHSERDHERRRSNESVLAICGVDLDVQELTAGFYATVAS